MSLTMTFFAFFLRFVLVEGVYVLNDDFFFFCETAV